jgi:hypothetical protein
VELSRSRVAFADAVHPLHAARPVGCWAPKQDKPAIEQRSGRERIKQTEALNISRGSVYYLPRPVPKTELRSCIASIGCTWSTHSPGPAC